jgi:hypothetical protein
LSRNNQVDFEEDLREVRRIPVSSRRNTVLRASKVNLTGGQVETSLGDRFPAVLQPLSSKDKIGRQRRDNIEVHWDGEDTSITGNSEDA